MDRRSFFRTIARPVSDTAKAPPPRLPARIRPPFAKPDIDFLLACTRCDKCILACPHQVLVRLPDGSAELDRGTPAMALNQRGCHLCDGWPCVIACEPQALILPDPFEAMPVLADARLVESSCLPFSGPECGACQSSCPVPGALVWDGPRPHLSEMCVGCGLCREACIVQPKAIVLSPVEVRHAT